MGLHKHNDTREPKSLATAQEDGLHGEPSAGAVLLNFEESMSPPEAVSFAELCAKHLK